MLEWKNGTHFLKESVWEYLIFLYIYIKLLWFTSVCICVETYTDSSYQNEVIKKVFISFLLIFTFGFSLC